MLDWTLRCPHNARGQSGGCTSPDSIVELIYRSLVIPSATASLPRSGYAFLAAITLFWGLNWPGMKIIVTEVPVWWFRASCLVIGGAALLLLSGLSGNRWLMYRREVAPIMLCTVFNVCCWHVLSAYGVSLMPAGRASIIAFTMPLWASMLAVWLLSERMTREKIIGLMFGIGGLGVLIGEDLAVIQSDSLGALCMLGAALGWAAGTVLFKRGGWDMPVASCIGWQLLIGSVPVTVGAYLIQPIPDVTNFSTQVWWALLYIYLFPMVFCQWAYLKVVKLFPASIAAIGTLMVPVVGVYSSSLLLSEQVGWREFLALVLICGGLLIVLVLPGKRGSLPQSS